MQLIKDDIEKEGVISVTIAACSRRSKTDAFTFENVTLSRANLREGVIWVTPDSEDKRNWCRKWPTTTCAWPAPNRPRCWCHRTNPSHGNNKRILVVGGGICGMTAALEASKTGYEVLLVEKTGSLGGWAAKLAKRVPFRELLCRAGGYRRRRPY